MSIELNILIIDDSLKDAILIERVLRAEWPGVVVERVETSSALGETLEQKTWDCVLCDMVMPDFGAQQALDQVREIRSNVPFIIVSGVVSIEAVISMLNAGANDFVRKDDLARLVPAINSAIEKARYLRQQSLSEQRLRLHREQTPLAVIEWDSDFQVIDWNAAAEKIFGYSRAEARGSSYADIMVSETNRESASAIARQVWEDLVAADASGKNVSEYQTRDGRTVRCEWHHTALRDDSGAIIGATSLVVDITAQYAAQRALFAREQEQREILNSLMDAVIGIDEEGEILSFNKAAEKLFGYRYEEIIGLNIARLMPEPDAAKHDDYLQHYLKTGEAQVIGFHREVIGLHKNQQTFLMRLSVAELSPDDAGKRRFIGSCHDLTLIKQQEEYLRRSEKMDALGKLTSGIAHDYNNMLGVVSGYSELIAGQLQDHSELAGYVEEIQKAADRGARLTRKLLSFSRKEETGVEKIDINEVLQMQQDMLQKTLTVSIQLLVEPADDLWLVLLDSSDLEEAIVNMSINAMHAMAGRDSGSRLTIQTANLVLNRADAKSLGIKAGEYVRLSLTDNGVGMDAAIKDKVFDPFFSTKGEKGTGLGLSQVFGFVKRAGGTVTVASKPGKGSQFVLYLPRCLKENVVAVDALPDDVADTKGSESILIVDDEASLRGLVVEQLSEQGYQVFSAESGAKALELLEHEHIDLVISDVIMPGMSGYQLAVAVQEIYPATKIQLVSGYSDGHAVVKGDKSLRRNLIFKPYKSEFLFKRIRVLLNQKMSSATVRGQREQV